MNNDFVLKYLIVYLIIYREVDDPIPTTVLPENPFGHEQMAIPALDDQLTQLFLRYPASHVAIESLEQSGRTARVTVGGMYRDVRWHNTCGDICYSVCSGQHDEVNMFSHPASRRII